MKRFLHTEQHAGVLAATAPDGILIQPASSLQCDMLLSGTGSCTVDWGDGTSTTLTLGTDTAFSRTYATGAERQIKLYGAITSMKSGTVFACGGNVSNLPSGLTLLSMLGANTITGDVADLPAGLSSITFAGSSALTGNVADLPSGLTYIFLYGSNTITGDVADLPTGMQYINIGGLNTLTSASTLPTPICYLLISHAFAATEVDNLLAAMWTNKDAAKPLTQRTIDLDGGGAATPSAAGLATKALLQAYRSPNNDPTKSLWTVQTN